MNEDQLKRLLAQASTPAWDDEVRAASALYAGQRRVTKTRHRTQTAGVIALLGAAASGLLLLIPPVTSHTTDIVLGCAEGLGTQGTGVIASGLDGVTLDVSNPTGTAVPVRAGGTTVLALPGASQITLPLSAGTATVQCGTGAPLRLAVERLGAQDNCTSVSTAFDSGVVAGQLGDLTATQVGALPVGATVDSTGTSTAPLRRVQVRSSGRVVAEALWHTMPGGNWQLESLSRCG